MKGQFYSQKFKTGIGKAINLGLISHSKTITRMEHGVETNKANLSHSLSVLLEFVGLMFTFVAVFLLHLFIIFGVGLPAYLNIHNPFSRKHILVGFNEFPSLVCWCIVVHHHRLKGHILFRRVGHPVSKSHP